MATTFDLFQIATLDDPYPMYARLRERHRVYDTGHGYWYVTRYEDIVRVLRDPTLVSGTGVIDSMGLTAGPLYDVMTSWLMALDGGTHQRARRLVASVFTPRAVESMRPSVADLVRVQLDLMEQRAADGPVDVIPWLAFPIPMNVVRMLFGVDVDEWNARVIGAFIPGPDGPVGMMNALIDYLADLVMRRRSQQGDDMFSLMFNADAAGERLSDHELVANGVLLITAGFETTMSLIGNAVVALATHPDQAEVLRREPTLAAGAVEEVLRWETPALTTSRRTKTPLSFDGLALPGDADVLFALAAGNRDPRMFDTPDTFDITRPDVRPLGFGGGLHVCLGAALARMEAQVVVQMLVERFRSVELAEPTIRWRKDNPTVRGPASLPVHLSR